MCPHTTLYMCPHTALCVLILDANLNEQVVFYTYVLMYLFFSYYSIHVLIYLFLSYCSIYVSSYYSIFVSSYCSKCVLILLYMCPDICVLLILEYERAGSALCVLILLYMCVLILLYICVLIYELS